MSSGEPGGGGAELAAPWGERPSGQAEAPSATVAPELGPPGEAAGEPAAASVDGPAPVPAGPGREEEGEGAAGGGTDVEGPAGDGAVAAGELATAGGEGAMAGREAVGAAAGLAPVRRAVQVEVVDVVLDLPQTHPIVVLRELEPPNRSLRFPVSAADGQALAYALRGIPTPRPLTHELFSAALGRLGVAVEAVQITGLVGMTLLAEVVLSGPQGQLTLECRPSDGIALALRQSLPVPITVTTDVLDEASDPA